MSILQIILKEKKIIINFKLISNNLNCAFYSFNVKYNCVWSFLKFKIVELGNWQYLVWYSVFVAHNMSSVNLKPVFYANWVQW